MTTQLTILIIISVLILIETSVLLAARRASLGVTRTGLRYGQRAILVDTSVLIDGRLLDIARAGFVPGRLVIPRSVLGELQLLADGADHEKRSRARNGLEVITNLQALPTVTVEIYRDAQEAREGVDNRLLALARRGGFELCTVDYNLQKVAQAEGITILSINELSQNLRAVYLPGETFELILKQKGQEKGQAIGYASDGTMVVVDHADSLLNKTVSVEVIRSLQTNSGKMLFAKLVQRDQTPKARGNGGEKTDGTPHRGRGRRGSGRTRSDTPPDSPAPITPRSPEDNLLNLVNKQ